MKTTKFLFHQQKRNDLFNICIRQMMSQVNQGKSFISQLMCIKERLSPITNRHGVKVRFKGFVFNKDFPIIGKSSIYFLQAFQCILKCFPEIQLPWKIGTVT